MVGSLVWWVFVGLVAGWATGKIMKGRGYGPLMDILLGMAGAVVGGWIFALLGIYPGGGLVPSVVVATVGGVILTWLVRKLKKV